MMYEGYGEELLRIRRDVAQPEDLSLEEREALHRRIETIMIKYQTHFEQWFEENDIDWVFAINMTLSDAVPVTIALHNAADKRWGDFRPGGILFWDHDLLGSYAVHEKNERVYPKRPNEFTLVPKNVPWHVWAVVSEVLSPETVTYPTELRALIVPNVLPVVSNQGVALQEPGIFAKFLEDFDLLDGVFDGRPVLLCPNRIFPVKGIDISIRLLAYIKAISIKRYLPVPYLLIFGDPEEDPEYATELQTLAHDEGLTSDIRFLGGVPLCSGIKDSRALLDEKDLLRLSAATHGGVLYTPNTTDVESVGLGPALASIAALPCLVSKFNALHQVYGDGLYCVQLDAKCEESFEGAAKEFVDLMTASNSDSGRTEDQRRLWENIVQQNSSLMLKKFPMREWKGLLLHLAAQGGVEDDVVLDARTALGIDHSITASIF